MRSLLPICALVVIVGATIGAASNLICYLNVESYTREEPAKFHLTDLDIALHFCTHLIVGYIGFNAETSKVYSLNNVVAERQYDEVRRLKEKHEHLKILLSLGGDEDTDEAAPNKYMELLEGGIEKQRPLIDSVTHLLRFYGFDGLDLAYQFPRNKPRKVHTEWGLWWKKFKKVFTGNFVVDTAAAEHKNQFTDFVAQLRTKLFNSGLMLSLTVLPNVNSSWYFDIPRIKDSFDLVTLAAFDFLTPERNPEEADFTAPLYELYDQDRLPHYNAKFQIAHWLDGDFPPEKLHLGVATYGRAWTMTEKSGVDGVPVIRDTEGPGPAGPLTRKPGLLSYMEICRMLQRNNANILVNGSPRSLNANRDNVKRYGAYAFQPADDRGNHGLWVSYEDLESAANKAIHTRVVKPIGGISLFDLSYDDFNGNCTKEKYPILRAIKYQL